MANVHIEGTCDPRFARVTGAFAESLESMAPQPR